METTEGFLIRVFSCKVAEFYGTDIMGCFSSNEYPSVCHTQGLEVKRDYMASILHGLC